MPDNTPPLVVVAAGGLGTRVHGWARIIPKEFYPVGGRPGIVRLLEETGRPCAQGCRPNAWRSRRSSDSRCLQLDRRLGPANLNLSRQERTRIRSSSCHIPPGMLRWLDSSIRADSTVAASPASTAR